MQQTIRINDHLVVGPQPTPNALDELNRTGIQSVINLRETREPEQPMSPNAERREVERRGMFYAHVPISTESLDQVALDELQLRLHQLPKPIYLHSWTGQRSTIAAALCLAVEHGWSGDEAVEHVENLGLECSEAMARFIRAYVDQRSPGNGAPPPLDLMPRG